MKNAGNAQLMNHSYSLKLSLFILLLSFQVKAQNFQKGFTDGYRKTLSNDRTGATQGFGDGGDPSKCDHWGGTYADGFTCGVKQATEYLQDRKKELARKEQNRPKELTINDINFDKPLENILDDIENRKQNIIQNIEPNTNEQAKREYIQVLETNTDQLVRVVTNRWNNLHQNNTGAETANNSNAELRYNPQYVQQLMQQQQQSQNNYNKEFESSLNELSSSMRGLSNSMQAMAMQNIKMELERRKNVANTFISEHSNRLNKLSALYKKIPESKFKQNLTGVYNGYFIMKKKYSFSNENELQTEIDCKIVIKNNVVKNIYLYGKKAFEIENPSKYPENSLLVNGIARYYDYDNLQESTIIVLEPYLNANSKNNLIISNEGAGFLTIWSNDKKDKGKKIYIQEISSNGAIIREYETGIIYAKNAKEIENSTDVLKIPFNTNTSFLFYGEVTNTPYGRFPLFPKISKKNNEPLSDNEHRYVEIKKYRE
ncbi:MAG: hypothetical protein CFE24_12960 [Flavobacterium sp. BFFFF2]|nr:MAG: hypothetical protein CFE24_12960 [Flavobacterium sp. BFFFF2]